MCLAKTYIGHRVCARVPRSAAGGRAARRGRATAWSELAIPIAIPRPWRIMWRMRGSRAAALQCIPLSILMEKIYIP